MPNGKVKMWEEDRHQQGEPASDRSRPNRISGTNLRSASDPEPLAIWPHLASLFRKQFPLFSFYFSFSTVSPSPPPIRVALTESVGRAVFATRPIAAADLIHTASPAICHPYSGRRERSHSTGSALNPKQTEVPRETHKQKLQKQSSVSSRRSSSSSSSSSTYYFYSSSQKASLKKNGGYSGNGVRISPVLNLPQAYIPKATARFFGFGSLFCNGKIKRKKK
ncbi:Histone-lysine N-methyltransferase [Vigna angularis]|uniref:Histone-lysine N-methyltransferase n=1 Tax=Phaseolus angularis TaxID=3914 RepID=A0A8T0JNS7_PHAAN|nr:Histone-lysine N-methyltransferase [Vigna angularis]